MKKFVSMVAIIVGLLFALVGAVAILKTKQTAIGIAALVAAGVLIAFGLFLKLKKRRRSSKKRPKGKGGRITTRTSQPGTAQKKKPVVPVKPKEKEEKERKPRPTLAPQDPFVVENEEPEEEKVDVAVEVQTLVASYQGIYAYESENAIAKVKNVECTSEGEKYNITLDVEISFFQGKLADEAATKAETNKIISAINDKMKTLRSKLEKIGVEHDVSANYDFNE